MPQRLKARIKSLTKSVRECRICTQLNAPPADRDQRLFVGYVRSGAQRDLAKLTAKSREAQLAYAFLRYRPYLMVERLCRPGNDPHWGHVENLIRKYSVEDFGSEGLSAVLQRFAEWRDSEDTTMSPETRDMLHKKWLERNAARDEAKSMVERAAAIAREGG